MKAVEVLKQRDQQQQMAIAEESSREAQRPDL